PSRPLAACGRARGWPSTLASPGCSCNGRSPGSQASRRGWPNQASTRRCCARRCWTSTSSDRLPAPVAGWTPRWRYVWPRDVAHVAVALAAVGNPDRALDALAFFRTVPRRAGLFEARYLLDGSGSPDQRTLQFDGLGWTLWALGRIHANGSTAVRQRIVDDFGDLAADLAGTICEQIDANHGLPPTSPDYWEHEESSLTLGTVAP